MPQKQLNCPNVLGTAVDQRCFSAANRVGAIGCWIQTDFLNPGIQYSCVLPSPQVWRFMNPAGKQKVVVDQLRFLDPCCNGISCWGSNFKLHRSGGFCCVTIARGDTRSPWQMSRTRKRTKSHALSLLSNPRSKSASSRVRWPSCSCIRMAQISLSFNGAFCPTIFPLFHGALEGVADAVSIVISCS